MAGRRDTTKQLFPDRKLDSHLMTAPPSRYEWDRSAPGLDVAGATDPGLQRPNNEDYVTHFESFYRSTDSNVEPIPVQVLVVADGMGGTHGGEQASFVAGKTMRKIFAEKEQLPPQERLHQAIRLANHQVYEMSRSDPALAHMGSTIVAAAVWLSGGDYRLFVHHVGDSRAYLLRNSQLHLLTVDHSLVQEAIDAKRITEQEAKTHPDRSVITRSLGFEKNVEVDTRVRDIDFPNGMRDSQRILVESITLHPNDVLLLCSDGLTDMVTDEEIRRILSSSAPQISVAKLVQTAVENGGEDNISAVVLRRQTTNAEVVVPHPGQVVFPMSVTRWIHRKRRWTPPMLGALSLIVLIALVVSILWRNGALERFEFEEAFTALILGSDEGNDLGNSSILAITPEANIAVLTVTDTPTPMPTATEVLEGMSTPLPTLQLSTTSEPTESPIATPINLETSVLVTATYPTEVSELAEVTTEQPVSTPTATNTVTATAIATVAMSTPVPERLLTPTRQPIDTPRPPTVIRPIPTPRPSLTQSVPAPSSTNSQQIPSTPTTSAPVPAPTLVRITLINPPDHATLQGEQTFSWSVKGEPASELLFDVRFWNNNDPVPKGRMSAQPKTSLTLNLDRTNFQQGVMYTWGVWIADSSAPDGWRHLEQTRTFVYMGASNNDGSSSDEPPSDSPVGPGSDKGNNGG